MNPLTRKPGVIGLAACTDPQVPGLALGQPRLEVHASTTLGHEY
jgi:hypothetical protein